VTRRLSAAVIADASLSTHVEHTIALTDDGPECKRPPDRDGVA
jgi:methionine aminopeptidase